MSQFKSFPESLDADEPVGKTYTFRIQVATGDSVSSAAITEVDSTSTQAPAVSLVTISAPSLGVIAGLLYGATFRAQGKGAPGNAFVRCRYTTALGMGDDITYELPITQR
jgi:hypothetical protein